MKAGECPKLDDCPKIKGTVQGMFMKLQTRVFELYDLKYGNITELAQAMGISHQQAYCVRQGKRGINQKFIVGAIKAFPEYRLDDLFYIVPEGRQNDRR